MEILAAFLLGLIAIFSAIWHYWPQITSWPESAAMFVGSIAGAGGGLFAILLGALYNAHLNRKRDDHLRDEKARALAKVLATEMEVVREVAEANANGIAKVRDGTHPIAGLRANEVPGTPALDAMIADIHLLPEEPRSLVLQMLESRALTKRMQDGLLVMVAIHDISPLPTFIADDLSQRYRRLSQIADRAARSLRAAQVG